MSPRTIRRAAERKKQKEARKAEKLAAAATPAIQEQNPSPAPLRDAPLSDALDVAAAPCPSEQTRLSAARLSANRANAQLSTGPTSPQGKAKVSLNAVKTALTGRTVLLAADDAAEYERFLAAYQKELRPSGQRECDLVQSIADLSWRLRRIPGLELAIYARGRIEFADQFHEYEAALRPGMIELETFLKYEKQLRNLQLQEARLARRLEKETAELRSMQQERNPKEADDYDIAAKLYLKALHDKESFDPVDYGFEFSTADVKNYLEGVRAANIMQITLKRDREAARDRSHSTAQAA